MSVQESLGEEYMSETHLYTNILTHLKHRRGMKFHKTNLETLIHSNQCPFYQAWHIVLNAT